MGMVEMLTAGRLSVGEILIGLALLCLAALAAGLALALKRQLRRCTRAEARSSISSGISDSIARVALAYASVCNNPGTQANSNPRSTTASRSMSTHGRNHTGSRRRTTSGQSASASLLRSFATVERCRPCGMCPGFAHRATVFG